jgi:hypothetical protein
MYDLSKDFRKFYYDKVVLSKQETNNLRQKKKLNIERLKEGLSEYNSENNKNYKIAETIEQGSVAMSTVTQNENKDYDIDVAIVFDDTNLNGIGHREVKNVIVNALKRKCTNFKVEPEALSNCVRIIYSDNYHIDFAIYKRIKNHDDSYNYEHAGSQKWNSRNPRAINNWFKEEIKINGEKLRQAIRLSKVFSKSRSYWNIPGGLIQSVLCDEKIQQYDRMDEMFYYTMVEIKQRLKSNIEVYNPTDNTLSLLHTNKDIEKMKNFSNILSEKISNLDVLFNSSCTTKKAIEAWNDFFNHEFWTYDEESEERALALSESAFISTGVRLREYDDTEQFIQNIMPVEEKYEIKINCKVKEYELYNKNIYIKQITNLSTLISSGKKIPLNRMLEFYLEVNKVPYPHDIYWKVKNNGYEAEKINCIRGEIFSNDNMPFDKLKEESSFEGEHYVECYAIKNGVCVARDRIEVSISAF